MTLLKGSESFNCGLKTKAAGYFVQRLPMWCDVRTNIFVRDVSICVRVTVENHMLPLLNVSLYVETN